MITRTRRHAHVAGLVAATTAVLLAIPAPAAGVITTTCSATGGRLEATTVTGDLHVDETCVLVDVTVTGAVTVDPGSTLILRFSEVGGDVLASGSVNLEQSRVLGGLRLERPGVHVLARRSTVRRSIRGTAHTVHLVTTRVDGAVTLTLGGRLWVVDRGGVGGWVTTRGGSVEVVDTRLDRGLTVIGATGRVRLCSVPIGSTVTVTGASGPVLVGTDPERSCIGYWRRDGVNVEGDLVLTDNTGTVRVGGSTYGRSLVCTGNAPAPEIGSVTFRHREGQCA
jgi:hypothetical protein